MMSSFISLHQAVNFRLRALLTQRADEGLRNQFGTRSVQEVVSEKEMSLWLI